MPVKPFIDKILITLEVGDKAAIFILLTKDGQLHRKGNGSAENTLPLIQGVSHQGHFEALMMTIDENIFNYTGVIRQPDIAGIETHLSLIFQGKDGTDYSFRVIYGSQSQGPPQELAQILINAVKITDAWYQEQLAQPAEEKKSKWKFWQ